MALDSRTQSGIELVIWLLESARLRPSRISLTSCNPFQQPVGMNQTPSLTAAPILGLAVSGEAGAKVNSI